jgi:hypothetical protein
MISTKVPVVLKPEYTMYLEDFNRMLWFHTDVYNWNKSIKSKFIKDLDVLQSLVTIPLAALVDDSNKKLIKFSRVVGFVPVETTNGADGKTYNILSRSL